MGRIGINTAGNAEHTTLQNQQTDDAHHAQAGTTARDINDVFPHKVCINLERRAERWQRMQVRFAQHGLHAVRRFAAVDGQGLALPPDWSGTPGAYGCLRSHLQVVREARKLGVPSVLIFEDDVVFDTCLQANFRHYIGQVPADWDMLYFGALHMEDPLEISANVQQIRRAYSTYAYALNHTVFDAFIDLNSQAATAVDVNNLALQTEHKCYCFTPHLAWVETDYSDAQGRENNHWYLQESLVIHGRGMDELLQQTTLIIAYSNPTRNDSITRNLLFLTRFYRARLAGVEVVVVEQAAEPTLNPLTLPAGCQYFFLRQAGSLNKGLCFNTGMNLAQPKNSLLIFSDSDLFVEEWDVCGNLRMCQRYDCATGFRQIIELTSTDTLQLQRDTALRLRWLDVRQYARREQRAVFSKYGVFNRRSIQAAGGWAEQRPAGAELRLSLQAGQQLRVFASPNHALRLHHD